MIYFQKLFVHIHRNTIKKVYNRLVEKKATTKEGDKKIRVQATRNIFDIQSDHEVK